MKILKKPRSYSDYTLDHLEDICGISNIFQQLGLGVRSLEPSAWLVSGLKKSNLMSFNSEKAKSEFMIAPVLMELASLNAGRFRCFSGNTLDVDKERSLRGRCDFLLTKHFSGNISAPIIAIFEAKDDNIDSERWFGQCGAEMFAARIFNEDRNEPIHIIHGAVTNGNAWRFLRLDGALLTIDTDVYTTGNLAQLLGVLQYLIDFYYQ
ncbi:MAG: hypothetical protein EAZ92_09345 [Candidatus Kapaibacterium sp.]|nr:MAG: hypothetical protein EAZ92_09345 [Candidatus Kapabacteria bacterium]